MSEKTPQEIARETAEETLAIHYFFSKIGFKFSEIYVGRGVSLDNPRERVAVILKAQDKEFVLSAGDYGVAAEEWPKYWNEMLEAHNNGITPEKRTHIWDKSRISSALVQTVGLMMDRGFEVDLPEQMKNEINVIYTMGVSLGLVPSNIKPKIEA